MRITGGYLKGRRIRVPNGEIRPAMDRMRESVFAVLVDLSGLSFLDLFSGSGIIALEAVSRGADYVEAVEIDPAKRRTLLENVQISPIRIHCRFVPAELYIKRAKRCFDMVFCDPPFPYQHRYELIEAIYSSRLLTENSLIILHRPREEKLMQNDRLAKEDYREYGRSVVDFYRFKKS